MRKVSGQLHEETSYGITGEKDEKGQEIFVYRKKLEDLTIAMVSKIVDPVVRKRVMERLCENGIDIEKGEKIPKEVWNKPLYMKRKKSDKKIQIKKVMRKKIPFIKEEARLDQVLNLFKKHKIHLFIVKKQGKVTGIITLENVLEEIVGEIVDEYDLTRELQKQPATS